MIIDAIAGSAAARLRAEVTADPTGRRGEIATGQAAQNLPSAAQILYNRAPICRKGIPMDGSLASIFDFYVFTSGRALFALRQVRSAAHEQGFTALVKHCDAAIAHGVATRQLERRWAGEPVDTGANPAAQRIDVLVDRTLGAIRDGAVNATQGAAPEDPIHAKADAFVNQVFPLGVFEVTSMAYVDELAAVDDIVALLKGKLAGDVKEFALGTLVKRLADLAVQYRDALEAPPQSLVAFGKVRAARSELQGMVLEAVAIIVGKHHERTPEGTAARLSLLDPILRQNAAIGQYLKARRNVQDVNPETGEDEPGPPGTATTPQDARAPEAGKIPEGEMGNG